VVNVTRQPRWARRALAGAAALAISLALASRGLCPMAPAKAVSPDAHACCQAGLQAASPSCCVDAPDGDTLAREAPPVAALAPLTVALPWPGLGVVRDVVTLTAGTDPPGASPPPSVLRI
jgi:hypothetical protein